ncbi:MAG: hypothetical protein NZ789_21105, partial [Pseudomonadales bacterium]|nr:hypothetical protein [Pseudomonadales bacterium]
MQILIVAEHDGESLLQASLSAIGFARSLSELSGGDVRALVIGDDVAAVSHQCTAYVPTLTVSDAILENPLADRYARVIAAVVAEQR